MTAALEVLAARQRVSRELPASRFSVEEGWGGGRLGKYNERRGLQRLDGLPRPVRFCGTVSRWSGELEVARSADTGRVFYRGEAHCNSVPACPCCRARKMGKWASTLMLHMDALRDRAGSEQLLTLTIPHRRGDDLPTLFRIMKSASRRLLSGAGWKALAERYGYLGCARVEEVTWSPFAGYHPHIHTLMFFAGPLSGEELARFRLALMARYVSLLYQEAEKAGHDLPTPDIDRVMSLQHASNAGQYITKMGLAEELTSPGTKVGREVHGVTHLTMAQLSRRLAWTRLRYGEEGPTDRKRDRARFASDVRVFKGYVDAMRGQQIFRIGQGLAAKINALPLRADVVPELSTMAGEPGDEEGEATETVITMTPPEWGRFSATGPRARVELERLSEQERAPVDVLRRFVRAVLEKRWRPCRDALWGENVDSPLFTSGGDDDGLVRPVRGEDQADGEAVPGPRADGGDDASGYALSDDGVLLRVVQGGGGAGPCACGRTHTGRLSRHAGAPRGHDGGAPRAAGRARRGRGPSAAASLARPLAVQLHIDAELDRRLDLAQAELRRERARDRHQYGREDG